MKKNHLLLILLLSLATYCFSQNLVSSQSWTIGSGSIGIFSQNGTDAQNVRELGIGPNNTQTILWKAVADAANNSDGGWDTQSFAIDNTKMYRYSVWIKKTNSTDGYTYFGCAANSILDLSGSVNTNPYFWYGDLPLLDKWYLLVGYVHGSADVSMNSYGGIYDGQTGAKVLSIQDFKFSPSATTASHRAYLYYDVTTSDRQYFYNPEVSKVEQPLVETVGSQIFSGNISVSGSVGIGTPTPRGKFDVDGPGDIYLSDDVNVGTGQSLFLPGHIYISPYAGANISYLQARRLDNSGTTSLRIRTYNSGSLTEAMQIEGNGNVGIGTTTPGNFKLAVNGKIWGTEVQVALTNPGPDYVFEKSYPLPTLEEVKSYIDENKHLPEIPSAKEMEENGVNVGEMNMLLLKKIEELTLYVIELKKIDHAHAERILDLEEKIKSLNKK
jgi:hypothetical protein